MYLNVPGISRTIKLVIICYSQQRLSYLFIKRTGFFLSCWEMRTKSISWAMAQRRLNLGIGHGCQLQKYWSTL
ncbi:30S ribosomal protein S16 [Bienertia sinuspersici]